MIWIKLLANKSDWTLNLFVSFIHDLIFSTTIVLLCLSLLQIIHILVNILVLVFLHSILSSLLFVCSSNEILSYQLRQINIPFLDLIFGQFRFIVRLNRRPRVLRNWGLVVSLILVNRDNIRICHTALILCNFWLRLIRIYRRVLWLLLGRWLWGVNHYCGVFFLGSCFWRWFLRIF